jgi:hypothetical protein
VYGTESRRRADWAARYRPPRFTKLVRNALSSLAIGRNPAELKTRAIRAVLAQEHRCTSAAADTLAGPAAKPDIAGVADRAIPIVHTERHRPAADVKANAVASPLTVDDPDLATAGARAILAVLAEELPGSG